MGLLAGGAAGSWGSGYLRSYLFGVRSSDAETLIAALGIAAALAFAAALRPARRASRTDPLRALRCE